MSFVSWIQGLFILLLCSNSTYFLSRRRQGIENARLLFDEIDLDGDGVINVEEFIAAYQKKDPNLEEEYLRRLFQEADTSGDGMIQFDEFVKGGSLLCNAYSHTIKMRCI